MALLHPAALRLKEVCDGAEESENKAHTMIEFEHAYDVIHREGVHGKVEITFVDGEADILRREVNIKLPRSPRKKPPLA